MGLNLSKPARSNLHSAICLAAVETTIFIIIDYPAFSNKEYNNICLDNSPSKPRFDYNFAS